MTTLSSFSQSTPFIGRDDELAKTIQLLTGPACRLLTLVGAGGIGKTRLAIQIANQVLQDFPDGVHVVLLAPLKSADNLITTIANAMRFPFHEGSDPRQQLLDFLHEKHLLLVLDNFEHLLAGTSFIRDILDTAPAVKILVTSRQTLNMQQEWVRQIEGLSFPSNEEIDQLQRYDAVQLFMECAFHVDADFSLDKEQLNVVRICQLVQGIPLAIELAAAWLKSLSCEDIADEIQRNVDFLATSLHDVPERHQSIRAVFEWSWLLLSNEERESFSKLSVFRGGFRREAAAKVAGASLPMLAALVSKSLIKRTRSGRYEIHELLRQYGEKQLVAAGENDTVQDAHSADYAEFLDQREADLKGRRQLAALDEIEADFENIRTAWNWAANRKLVDLLNRAMESLRLFCEMRSRFQEGEELFEYAVRQLASDSDAALFAGMERALARQIRLQVLGILEHHSDLSLQIERCLASARARDDAVETAFCMAVLGEIHMSIGNYVQAISCLEECLNYYAEVNDIFHQGRVYQRLGLCNFELHPSLYVQFATQGLDLAREAGDRIGMANCLYNLGSANAMAGNYTENEYQQTESLSIRREIGDLANISVNLGGLSFTALVRGDVEKSTSLALEALQIADAIHHIDGRNFALLQLGLLAVLREDYYEGKRLCEESRAMTTRKAFNPLRTALTDAVLALAACGLMDDLAARVQVQKALRFGANRGLLEVLKYGLPTVAILLAHQGEQTYAVEALALASAPPGGLSGWMDKCPLLLRLRAELNDRLGSDIFEATWTKVVTGDFETILSRLQELQFVSVDSGAGMPRPHTLSVNSDQNQTNRMMADVLTERELEMLRLIADGLSNQEIAQHLYVEVSTVKKHINHIFSKLGANSRTQAIVRARELKLL